MPLITPPSWTLVSLRPQGGHAGLRAAVHGHGGRLLALSPWRLRARRDAATRSQLDQALQAQAVVFTSPAAVRAAAGLRGLEPRPGQAWLAVGEGSARALQAQGITQVRYPQRMDSEGLLALPELAAAASVGLVTAPGGRGMIAAALAARGSQVHRADVYERLVLPPPTRTAARLRGLDGPRVLALSSAEALQIAFGQWPAAVAQALARCAVVAASARLADLAAAQGLDRITVAASARPRDLADTAATLVGAS
jgi:uroporphyrinogen-III synthase